MWAFLLENFLEWIGRRWYRNTKSSSRICGYSATSADLLCLDMPCLADTRLACPLFARSNQHLSRIPSFYLMLLTVPNAMVLQSAACTKPRGNGGPLHSASRTLPAAQPEDLLYSGLWHSYLSFKACNSTMATIG